MLHGILQLLCQACPQLMRYVRQARSTSVACHVIEMPRAGLFLVLLCTRASGVKVLQWGLEHKGAQEEALLSCLCHTAQHDLERHTSSLAPALDFQEVLSSCKALARSRSWA